MRPAGLTMVDASESRPARVVVIGGGIAGLAASLFLARRGVTALVVERDPAPGPLSGVEAFDEWERPSVPQWRLPHSFAIRARHVLEELAPDVLDRLREDGIDSWNVVEFLLPPSQRQPGDETYAAVLSRRPAFELALRRSVEAQRGVEILSGTVVAGLVLRDGTPQVGGVRLSDGTEVRADIVLDCGGRRSKVPGWLSEAGIPVEVEVEDCGLTYYSRYFQALPGDAPMASELPRADLGYLLYWTFIGDHGTYGIAFGAPPWDEELRSLRHVRAWDVMAGAVPKLADLVSRGTPLHDVQVMAGNKNVRRRYTDGERPVVLGLLSLGDALATTNPFFAGGASLALLHAAAAADVIATAPDDLDQIGRRYYERISGPTDAVYEACAGSDRIRVRRWQGEEIPPEDAVLADREDLLERGVRRGMREDPDLLRAFVRRVSLLDPPDALFADEELVARAEAARQAPVDQAAAGPSRTEALALLRRLRPGVGAGRQARTRSST